MPPARRSSPVSRAHDAHFQGRRCHGQAEMQQPTACLSRGRVAYARSALPAAAPEGPTPPTSPPMAEATPNWEPRATADSLGGPAPPLPRTTAHAWAWLPSGRLPHRPCPGHAGTCSPHPLPPSAQLYGPAHCATCSLGYLRRDLRSQRGRLLFHSLGRTGLALLAVVLLAVRSRHLKQKELSLQFGAEKD